MKFTNLHKIIALFLIILAILIGSYFLPKNLLEGMDNDSSENFYDTYNTNALTNCNSSGVSPSDCNNLLTSISQSCAQTLLPDDYTKCGNNVISTASAAYIASHPSTNQSTTQGDSNIPGSSIFSSLANTMDQASANISNAFSTQNSNQNNQNNVNTNQNPSSIITTSNGQQILATSQNTMNGIPVSQIPQGQEALYILKSEIVPPICPACPNVIINDNLMKSKCQPCPSCERCPEPAFDCKKVPNYAQGQSNSYLPRAILNDFSQFGA